MAAPTTQELIDAMKTALAGSSDGIAEYEYNGRRVVRMKPSELMKTIGILEARLAREQSGGMFRVARFGETC